MIQERKPMKRTTLSILIIVGFLLAACSSFSGTSTGSTNNDLPIETQLAVGTLKLAGTEQDVTAEQAEQLTILWQTYQQLSQSDTAAQAEVDGLIAQIQETMTTEQMQSITAMQITQQDVAASMQGVTTVVSSSSDSAKTDTSSGGDMPAGGPPSDGGGAPMDGGMPSEMGGEASVSGTGQTQSAQASGSQSLTKVPSMLVEAVIAALQQKVAA
jgi:hypothetical protein